MIRFLIAFILCFCFVSVKAQRQDSLIMETEQMIIDHTADSARIRAHRARYNPRKALLYSAIFPGLGQVYNRKYWKVPLVYGGIVGIGIALDFYVDQYKNYKGQLFYILENNSQQSQQGFTEAQLRPAIDRARRERDFMLILMGGMYILQMIDAHVDAHLKEFDINPSLQVRLRPSVSNDALIGRQTGISLTIKF